MKSISVMLVVALALTTISPAFGETADTITIPATPDDWLGQSAQELIACWGAPDKIYAAPDGSKILLYAKGREVAMSRDDPMDSLSRKPRMTVLNHDLEFRTDIAGVIVGHNWNGPPLGRRFAHWMAGTAIAGGLIMVVGFIVFVIFMPKGGATPLPHA